MFFKLHRYCAYSHCNAELSFGTGIKVVLCYERIRCNECGKADDNGMEFYFCDPGHLANWTSMQTEWPVVKTTKQLGEEYEERSKEYMPEMEKLVLADWTKMFEDKGTNKWQKST